MKRRGGALGDVEKGPADSLDGSEALVEGACRPELGEQLIGDRLAGDVVQGMTFEHLGLHDKGGGRERVM